MNSSLKVTQTISACIDLWLSSLEKGQKKDGKKNEKEMEGEIKSR